MLRGGKGSKVGNLQDERTDPVYVPSCVDLPKRTRLKKQKRKLETEFIWTL